MKRVIQYTAFFFLIGLLGIFVYNPAEEITPEINDIESTITTSPTIPTEKKGYGEIAAIPENFDQLIDEEHITDKDKERYVAETDINGNPYLANSHSFDTTEPSNIEVNLLTGEDLWKYKPTLLDTVKKQQGIPMLPVESIVEINDGLLTNLSVGDSLYFTMPNGSEQQIVVSKVNKINDKVTAWDLQNTQGQDIGKITQINTLTEGSFITDTNEEYHLRTVNNKGWITSKQQLISNNDEAVRRNREAYADLIN